MLLGERSSGLAQRMLDTSVMVSRRICTFSLKNSCQRNESYQVLLHNVLLFSIFVEINDSMFTNFISSFNLRAHLISTFLTAVQ